MFYKEELLPLNKYFDEEVIEFVRDFNIGNGPIHKRILDKLLNYVEDSKAKPQVFKYNGYQKLHDKLLVLVNDFIYKCAETMVTVEVDNNYAHFNDDIEDDIALNMKYSEELNNMLNEVEKILDLFKKEQELDYIN